MNPAFIAQLIQYAAFVPDGIKIINETISAVKELVDEGQATDEKLEALGAAIVASHNLLPPPE